MGFKPRTAIYAVMDKDEVFWGVGRNPALAFEDAEYCIREYNDQALLLDDELISSRSMRAVRISSELAQRIHDVGGACVDVAVRGGVYGLA